jgi:hypothetical protein
MKSLKKIDLQARKGLRTQYFLDLKLLQKKYDKLLAEDEKKEHPVLTNEQRKQQSKNDYNSFMKQLNKLFTNYQNQRNEYLDELKIVKRKREHEAIVNIQIKLKAIKHQFKISKKRLRFEYYLKTIDPIRANYIREREQLTETYRQKSHSIH